MAKIACAYCNTINDSTQKNCLACGAPLEAPPAIVHITPAWPITTTPPPSGPVIQTEDMRKAGETAEKVFNTAVNVYHIALRTIAEALAIAVSAFALGLIGSVTGLPAAALIGAVLVGIAVSIPDKWAVLAAISAPVGVLVGCLIWLLPWQLGAGPRGMVFTGMLFGVIGALVGGRRYRRSWWDYLRPFLGAAGALGFALLGLAIGAGLNWAVSAIGG